MWGKCKDTTELKQGYTIAKQNVAIVQAQAMSLTIAGLIFTVQCTSLLPNSSVALLV
jgi:hypothetical protein